MIMKIYHGIKNLYDEIGGFGVLLLLAGKDWDTREQRERSMQLFMSDVAPAWLILIPTERSHEQEWSNRFKIIGEGRLANAT